MFSFCRRFKLFISYVLIFSHLQSSTALATHNFLVLEVEERDPSSLSLKVGHHILAQDGQEQKIEIGHYQLPFDDLPVYSSFQGNCLFQGLSTKEACTLRLGYEQAEINFVVYQDGKIIVRDMLSPDSGIKINSFGQVITYLGDVQSFSVTGKDFKNLGNLQAQEKVSINVTGSLSQEGEDALIKSKNFDFSCDALSLLGKTAISEKIHGTIQGNQIEYFTPPQGENDAPQASTLSAAQSVTLNVVSNPFAHPLVTAGSFHLNIMQGVPPVDVRLPSFMKIGGDLSLNTPAGGLVLGQAEGSSSKVFAKGNVVLNGERIDIQNGGIAAGEDIEIGAQTFKIGSTISVVKTQNLTLPGGSPATLSFKEEVSNGNFVHSKKNLKITSSQILMDMARLSSGQNLEVQANQNLTLQSASIKAGGNGIISSPDVSMLRKISSSEGYNPEVDNWYINAVLPNSTGSEIHAEGLLTFLNLEKGVCQGGSITSSTSIQGHEKMTYEQLYKTISVDVPKDVVFYVAKYFSNLNFLPYAMPQLNKLKPDNFGSYQLPFPWGTCTQCISKNSKLILEGPQKQALLKKIKIIKAEEDELKKRLMRTHGGYQRDQEFARFAKSRTPPIPDQQIIEKCRYCFTEDLRAKYESEVVKEALSKLPQSAVKFFQTFNFQLTSPALTFNFRPTSPARENLRKKIASIPDNRPLVIPGGYFPFMPMVVLNEMVEINRVAAPQVTLDLPVDLDFSHLILQAPDFKAQKYKHMTVGRFLSPTGSRHTPFHHRQDLIDYMPVSQLQIESLQDPWARFVLPAVLRDAEEEKRFPSPVVITRNSLSTNSPYKRLYHPYFEMDAVQAALLKNLNRPFLDFSGKATREAVYNHLMMNTQVVRRALEGRSTPEDMKRFSAISDSPSNQLIIPTSSGESRTILFDEPFLLHYPVEMNGETFLGATILSPPSCEDKNKPMRSLAGGIFSRIANHKDGHLLEILGSLYAQEKGILDVKTKVVKAQVQYRNIPTSYYHLSQEQRLALIQAQTPTALTHYLASSTPGMYVLLNQGAITGGAWESHGESMELEPGALVEGEESLWLNDNKTMNRGRVKTPLAIVDSKRFQNVNEQRLWQTIHDIVRKKSRWLILSDTSVSPYTVNHQESYPHELSGTLDILQLVADSRFDVSDEYPARQTRNDPYIHHFENRGGKIYSGLGGLRLYSYSFASFSQRDVIVVPYSTKAGGVWGSVRETGVVRREIARPAEFASEGPMNIEFWQGVIEGGSLFEIIGLNPQEEVTVVSHEQIDFPGMILFVEEPPHLKQKGWAIQRFSGFHEKGLRARFSAPHSSVSLEAKGSVKGVRPQIESGNKPLLLEGPQSSLGNGAQDTDTTLALREQNTSKVLALLQSEESFKQGLRHVQHVEIIDSIIPPEVFMLVQLGVSLGTAGLLPPGWGTLLTTAISTTAGKGASSLLAHSGNIGKALQDLSSREFLRSTALNIASAGLTQGISTQLGLPIRPQTFIGHVQKNLIRVGVKAAFEGRLDKDLALDFLTSTIGGSLSNQIGSLYGSGEINPMTHKLLHGLVGAPRVRYCLPILAVGPLREPWERSWPKSLLKPWCHRAVC